MADKCAALEEEEGRITHSRGWEGGSSSARHLRVLVHEEDGGWEGPLWTRRRVQRPPWFAECGTFRRRGELTEVLRQGCVRSWE